jgi:hypothetical protein
VKLTTAERDRWLRAAVTNGMRLTELVKEGVRGHLRQLETLALLGRTAEPAQQAPPTPTKAVG